MTTSVEVVVAENMAAPSPPHINKDKFKKEYKAELDTMKILALVSTSIYSLNWFLGVCALTWASAVILGGLLTLLSEQDFYIVSALLLLEAVRLATATFFSNLVTRKLIHRGTHPAHIKYDDNDRNLLLAGVRILDQTCQLMVVAVSIFLTLKRLPSLPWHHPQDRTAKQISTVSPQGSSAHFDSLNHSLRIFYILVFLNAAIAVVGVLHSKTLVPFFTTSFSLRRYYDHVVWQGMDKGVLYATDFDFLTFAFKAFADEYRRNLRASVVYELYRDLVIYIYAHNRGFDAARVAMDSSDHCEQEAAANIVGLWTYEIEGAGSDLLLQSRLLTKLADALDHQEVGRAATYSFQSLAKSNAEGLLEVKNERGERLMLILSNCIGKAVKAKKEDKALVFIKVLIHLLRTEAGRKEAVATERRRRQEEAVIEVEDPGQQQEAAEIKGRMVEDLGRVFRGKGCKKRTVGVAGKALKLMGEELSAEEVEKWLKAPVPSEEEHVLEEEKGYLLELLGEDSFPATWQQKVCVRLDTSPRSGQSPRQRSVVGLLSFLPFLLIVIAVTMCLYKLKL